MNGFQIRSIEDLELLEESYEERSAALQESIDEDAEAHFAHVARLMGKGMTHEEAEAEMTRIYEASENAN